MAYETIRYTVDAGVGTILLNRPEKLNAINAHMMREINGALDEAQADDTVRVLIIKGAGRAFSSGVDLGDKEPTPAHTGITKDRDRLHGNLSSMLRFWDFPKPVIAQVHGYCIAGGTMLTVFCDLTIVAEDAVIRWPAVPIGGGYISPLWTWLVGPKKAKEMSFIAGSEMSGAEAHMWGWANHAVPADKLEDMTLGLARRIAKTPSDLLRVKKLAINRVMEIQGFRTAVMGGAEWDSLAHHSEGAESMRAKVHELGLKGAIAWFNEQG